jgi:hypothetical protein
MPGIKKAAPTNSAEMQYHGVIEGYPFAAKLDHHVFRPPGSTGACGRAIIANGGDFRNPPRSPVRAHYPAADFHEDPARILSLSERPLVLNEGHRCAHASRRVCLEAGKLDEAKTEVAARTDTHGPGRRASCRRQARPR